MAESIEPKDVPGAGYHWYKLGTLPIASSTYIYFFWSWIIQFPVDAEVDVHGNLNRLNSDGLRLDTYATGKRHRYQHEQEQNDDVKVFHGPIPRSSVPCGPARSCGRP